MSERDKRYYWEHREEKLAKTKAWREKNKDTCLAKGRAKYREQLQMNPDYNKEQYQKHRDKKLKYAKSEESYAKRRLRTTGHSKEYFLKQFGLQDGLCGICSQLLNGSSHADHNHITKQPRGILCMKCNLGIGHFQDDPKLILKALNYLKDWE